MEIVIVGYGLNESRTIRAKLEKVTRNSVLLRVPAIGKYMVWSFNPGTGHQIGYPISGYRISPADLKRIRESHSA